MLLVGIKREQIGADRIVKSELINNTWINTNKKYKKNDVEFIINTFLRTIIDGLKEEHNVKIDGFGSFSSYLRHAYIGKNANGIVEEIPETKYISFKPSKKLKE